MTGVFLSYRRSDTQRHARRLYEWLAARYGNQHVFMDIDSIAAGEKFRERISEAIDQSAVVIALLGPAWAQAADDAGQLRLENADDWVRLEISLSLKRNRMLIPVLVAGASMPAPNQVPKELAGLLDWNAHTLSDSRWKQDFVALVERLDEVLGELSERGAPTARPATDEALANQLEELMFAVADDKPYGVSDLFRELVLPEADVWFVDVFGPEIGRALGREYQEMPRRLPFQMRKFFANIVREGRTLVSSHHAASTVEDQGTGLQRKALAAMRRPVTLYSADFVGEGKDTGTHLWSFVHVQGSFRYIGKLYALDAERRDGLKV